MSDNNDDDDINGDIPEDFDDDDFNDSFEDFESGNGSLGETIQSNPLIKVGIVAGALVVIIGGIILFGGKDDPVTPSRVASAPDISEPPGTEEVSEVYRQAIEERNLQQREKALREGGSSIPEPTGPPVGRVTLQAEKPPEEDPLARWRRIQEERQRQQAQQPAPQLPPQPPIDTSAPAINALAEAQARQMESILGGIAPAAPRHVVITPPVTNANSSLSGIPGSGTQFAGIGGNQQLAQQLALQQQQQQQTRVVDIIIPAGTIEYAQLITEASTDAPGPILAQIMSGPLSGSRLLGSFQQGNDLLVLNFNTVVVEGISRQASAIALDPAKSSPGVVTEVDQRYFKRVILPAAASFIQGVGEGIANAGSTNVSVQGETVSQEEEDLDLREELFSGVEEAADTLGDLIEREAQRTKPLIRVAAGTPVAIMFLAPVTEENTNNVQ